MISLYVALRFERKFTIPVLIALTHDLLITAGVYALLGREVTVDTVAALFGHHHRRLERRDLRRRFRARIGL